MRIIALFNLKPGVAAADYEAWARKRDIPGVRSLISVTDFEVLRATGVLFSDAAPPYAYIEILDVTDRDEFLADCAGATVQALAAEMGEYAVGATFITTERMAEIG